MLYLQTLSTDNIEKLNYSKVREMLDMLFLSALTIKKTKPKTTTFKLITDTKGFELVSDWDIYDDIDTSLNDYPYQRPVCLSSYKPYSIELFKNNFVHFDNDVFLFKSLPDFEDVLVQSNELNFIEFLTEHTIKNSDWILPDYKDKIKNNYNPGVFGFSNSQKATKTAKEFYSEFRKYSEKNLAKLTKNNNHQTGLLKYKLFEDIKRERMQDLYCILEEGLLWYFCYLEKANVVEIQKNKYDNETNLWGTKSKNYNDVKWDRVIELTHLQWKKWKYAHFIAQKEVDPYYCQTVYQEIYRLYPEEVNKKVGLC